ncbi:MAG: peptidoglycan-binding protein [Acidobacteria bacterium]|nr:peptidoglycan-binding protein [Acidobacteriota bacterium]
MPMAGDNDKDKKGFSGLSDLASEVGGIDEPIKPEPKAEAKPSTPKQTPQPQREAAPSEPVRKTTSSPPPIETVSSGKSGGGSGGKWILGIIGVVFVIWLINNLGQTNKKPSYTPPSSSQSYSYPQSTPAPAVQTPSSNQITGLQYTKPSVGTNNVLSVPEICWCIREGIRIEAMRDVIDTNEGIDEFNRIVNDYNSRCGSYRYRQGSQSRAERDVEPYRSQIVEEAIREARQLGSRSYPSVSPGASTSSAPKKPNAQYTKEAQQILTDLGYEPGSVDGDYGRRTADAVKAFQRDAGITQDGWIDEDLLSTLRRVKAAYKSSVGSQPKPQTQTSLQPLSNTPSAVTTATPENLSYEEQSKYSSAQRLRRLGYDVDWRTSSLTDMLDAESRIGTANRLARLGYNVDWRTSSLTDMLDAESRIGTANRLKRKGISVDWRNYSLTQLLNMERGQK